MTTEIEVVNLNEGAVQTTNALNLHAKLGIKKDFSSWIKVQLVRADLAEGVDYLLTQKGEQLPSGTKYSVEYHLTLEACEHIALMSSTAKGKEIRKEYIAIRKQFLADQRIVFEAGALKQIERDYAENLKHHPNYQLGEALKDAIQTEEYDNAAYIDRMLDGMDLESAAHAQGMSVGAVRRQVASHTIATLMLGQMHRGEHQHESKVKNVVGWARSIVQEESAKTKRLSYEREMARRPKTLDEIVAYDMAHKHDNRLRVVKT